MSAGMVLSHLASVILSLYAVMEIPLTLFWYAYVIAYATAAPRSPEILLNSVTLALGLATEESLVGRNSHRITSAMQLMPGQ